MFSPFPQSSGSFFKQVPSSFSFLWLDSIRTIPFPFPRPATTYSNEIFNFRRRKWRKKSSFFIVGDVIYSNTLLYILFSFADGKNQKQIIIEADTRVVSSGLMEKSDEQNPINDIAPIHGIIVVAYFFTGKRSINGNKIEHMIILKWQGAKLESANASLLGPTYK